MAFLIKAGLVLHNWMVDLDSTRAEPNMPIKDWMEINRVWWAGPDDENEDHPSARAKCEAIKDCLFAQRGLPALPQLVET